MEWHHDAGRHTLQQGEYTGEVRHTTDDTWIARIGTGQFTASTGRFPTLDEAQAWCTTQMAYAHRFGVLGEEQ
jgi:hypothetical protein